jgi:hypothetical protein
MANKPRLFLHTKGMMELKTTQQQWFAAFLPQPCIFDLEGGSKDNNRHMSLQSFAQQDM